MRESCLFFFIPAVATLAESLIASCLQYLFFTPCLSHRHTILCTKVRLMTCVLLRCNSDLTWLKANTKTSDFKMVVWAIEVRPPPPFSVCVCFLKPGYDALKDPLEIELKEF